MRFYAIIAILALFCACSGSNNNEEPEDNPPEETITLERLYIGTGEYSAMQDWHAILRFDDSAEIDDSSSGTATTPDATVNVQASGDADGIFLNFVHTFFVDEESDELYAGSLFTTSDNHNCSGPTEVCGSIAIFSNASTMDGPQTVTRHIFGDATEINQPHGVWVDTQRDILYAANTFSANILVWDNASTADGNLAPDRIISHSEKLNAAVYVYVDVENDRLFVANMAGGGGTPGSEPPDPSVLIYNDASTLDGEVEPDLRIVGDNTRLSEGNNQTTHNVWYDSTTEIMFVGHHINEILIFDMSDVDFNPTSPTDLDLTPRVLKINEQSDDSDQYLWSAYGLFYLPSQDRLYVSASYQASGTEMSSGPPQSGSPDQAIKIYDGISDPDIAGVVTPTREIYWDSGDQYYPAQPLWVQEYEVTP